MVELTVSVLEEYLRDHYGTTVPEQSLFMKLVEEIGEVAELLNKRAGRKMMDGEEDSSACLAEEQRLFGWLRISCRDGGIGIRTALKMLRALGS